MRVQWIIYWKYFHSCFFASCIYLKLFLVITCKTLGSPTDGNNNCSHSSNLGVTCHISCAEGFFLNGTSDIECIDIDGTDANGDWSEPLPTCDGS